MYPYPLVNDIVFFSVFGIIIGVFIIFIIMGIVQWNKNNNSPVLSVYARVVAKRISVSDHVHTDSNGFSHNSSSTSYYVTFQVESGDRLEFHMNGNEYGLLIEGDEGKLTFQGTRYKGFNRTI